MSRKNLIISSMLVALIIGCAPQPAAPTSDLLATIVAGTLSVIQVTPTTSPQATLDVADGPFMITPTAEGITLSPEQIKQGSNRYMYTSSENVNFRVGPGKLFQVSRVFAKGTRLEVLGYSANNLWIYVKNDEGIIGWVDGRFVDGGSDGPPLPTVLPTNAVTVKGDIQSLSGPVDYIGIALVQGDQFDETYTDESGNFYIYVPETLNGDWFLQEYSIDCRSTLMDANCKCLNNSCGSLDPAISKITFPLTSDAVYITLEWH